MTQLHPDFDPTFDHVVRVSDVKVAPDEDETLMPYTVAGQIKLFKAGLLGVAVTMWSEASGGVIYPRTQLMIDADTEWVCTVEEEKAEEAIGFAGGYIFGWYEAQGGKPEDLKIWLERKTFA